MQKPSENYFKKKTFICKTANQKLAHFAFFAKNVKQYVKIFQKLGYIIYEELKNLDKPHFNVISTTSTMKLIRIFIIFLKY